MRRQIITVIMLCVFTWANAAMVWGKNLPQPEEAPVPSLPVSYEPFFSQNEPIISWGEKNVMAICTADCGSAPKTVYALYQVQGFPQGTTWEKEKTENGWLIKYKLPGTKESQVITQAMVFHDTQFTSPESSGHRYYKAWTQEGTSLQETDDLTVIFSQAGTDIASGKPIYNLCVINKKTGQTILSTVEIDTDIKITHWAQLLKDLGIAAAIVTGVGVVTFWLPGGLALLIGPTLF